MKGKRYHMQKLAESGRFDITVAQRFYYNSQEYFDALSEFSQNHISPLKHYTPAFVVNSDDERNAFIAECCEVRADFMRMGLISLLEDVATMEDAVIKRDMKEFSDGQVKFLANLNICMDIIKDAETLWVINR